MPIGHDGGVTSLQHIHPPLVQCAIETERYVAAAGWDQPVRLFALVETAALLAAEPASAQQLGRDPGADPADALSAIEQDGLPPTDPLEDFLGMLAWPPDVAGAAPVSYTHLDVYKRQVEERFGEVCLALPLARIHQALQPRAIGAGLAAEDAVTGADRGVPL